MRPEEIEKLMEALAKPKVTHTLRQEGDRGRDPE